MECAKRGMGVVVTYNSNPEKAEAVVQAITGMGGKALPRLRTRRHRSD